MRDIIETNKVMLNNYEITCKGRRGLLFKQLKKLLYMSFKKISVIFAHHCTGTVGDLPGLPQGRLWSTLLDPCPLNVFVT